MMREQVVSKSWETSITIPVFKKEEKKSGKVEGNDLSEFNNVKFNPHFKIST